jgi:ParB family chromosome partitioning protein
MPGKGAIVSTEKRKVLGRGLDTLLPATRNAARPSSSPANAELEIDVELIDRNPYQTRTVFEEAALEELSASIKANGVVQPILVRTHGNGRYELIAGERRLMASKKAGKSKIPAVIRNVSNEQAMEITIIENLQREDLNAMEQARAFDRLSSEFGLTQEQMAQRTGKDRSSVANFLRLLKLPPDVQRFVEDGRLTLGHAKALLALDSVEAVQKFAQRVINLSLSVRQTEAAVTGFLNPETKEEKPERKVDPNVREAERELQRILGVKVQIEDKNGRGKIMIQYKSLEDFDRVVEALGALK